MAVSRNGAAQHRWYAATGVAVRRSRADRRFSPLARPARRLMLRPTGPPRGRGGPGSREGDPMARAAGLLLGFALGAGAATAAAQELPVDLELVLAVDVSG